MSAIPLPSRQATASTVRRAAPISIPLTQVKRGERAVIELGQLHADETRLLEAMGLADESEVRICRSGGTCIVQVEATRLGISAAMAARILARPCACHGIGADGSETTSCEQPGVANDACR